MNAEGGCEAAVTAIARCGWAKLRGCGELLHCMKFPLKSYISPEILYGSEA